MWLIGKKNYNDLDDPELLKLYRTKDDRQAIGALFQRYSHLIFGVCMKYLKNEENSKDATLQIFEKLMKDLKRFDVERFSNWVHSVARNHCLMELRSRKTFIYTDDESMPDMDVLAEQKPGSSSAQENHLEEQLQLLEEAIENLNEEQRVCIDLFYLKKYCYQDVSEISGFTLNEVKSYIQNGKRNLKIYMMKKSHERSN
jgi:RNA polymerase sigma factor (sigma-70 family)